MGKKRKRENNTNRSIHPRNKYSGNPPDFKLLASFQPYVFYSSNNGKPNINWKDFNATRELTRVLLLHDHQITWKQLIKAIPGLRPWEVLSVEQAMDQITYSGKWYREPLGAFTTGPPYIQEWNEDVEDFIDSYQQFTEMMCEFLEESIPGFNKVLDKVDAEAEEKYRRRMASGKKKIEAIKRARRPKRVDADDDENEDL